MANLESRADKAVRDAVDAFMDGRLVPRFGGEIVFETKNSRYRLLDGVVFAAPDSSLVGAELVGWLSETSRRCLIEWSWQPGSRAVLVDRKRGRNIIVTSTTRLMHQEEQAPPSFEREPELPGHNDSWSAPPFPDDEPPPGPAPAFSARRVPIIASTPPPAPARGAEPASEPPPGPAPPTIPRAPSPFGSAAQVAVPAPAPSPPRRAAPVHAPPRPLKAPAAAAPRSGSGVTPLPRARPVPLPAPPPRRESPPPPAFTSTPGVQAPARPFIPRPAGVPRGPVPGATSAPSEWELTSAEFEMETAIDEPPAAERTEHGPAHHDASHHQPVARGPASPPVPQGMSQAELDAADDAMDPVTSEPFPLLRSVEPSGGPSGSFQASRGAPRR